MNKQCILRGMKIIYLNDWSTLKRNSLGVHLLTLFNLSVGRIDMPDIKIYFSFQLLGIGFQVQDK